MECHGIYIYIFIYIYIYIIECKWNMISFMDD